MSFQFLDETRQCNCVYRKEAPTVGPYCNRWNGHDKSFCYLSGGMKAKYCPGSVKSSRGEFYGTWDKGVCSRSKARGKRKLENPLN